MEKNTGNKLGLSEQEKFDVKKPLRGETANGQRPAPKPAETVKTEKGTFKMR